VAAISSGRPSIATTARPASVTSSAMATPTTVSTLISAVDRPVCRNVDSASTSVVIRVMIRPAISRSK
jgi:hypothetical protein